jgi:two-component system OmpR family sensor kinase
VRARLALWFVLGTFIIGAAGAAVTYGAVVQRQQRDLDVDLAEQLLRFERAVAASQDEAALLRSTQEYLAGAGGGSLSANGITLCVQTVAGKVVSNSSELRLEELPEARSLLAGGARFLVTADLAGSRYRVAGAPVLLGDRPVGAAEVAASEVEIERTRRRVLVLLGVGLIVGCLVAGLGAWLLVDRALLPVRRITRTAAAISSEDLSRRIGYRGPQDQIGELATTMDSMLDRIQGAFEGQERFLSDISHELRTPLTIAKGHLQVLDRQNPLNPETVRAEHHLVVEELDRMSRLVADLLVLSRAKRSDFLRKEVIELDRFLNTLAAHGPHMGDREWHIDSLPGGVVIADQDRLTQIILNLMTNAVAHTRPGQVVALGGRRAEGAVTLWVRDEGEGMRPEDREHAFERFYRGRGRGQLGLGLAIVQALVEAHGGQVDVDATPAQGARFTITLPG